MASVLSPILEQYEKAVLSPGDQNGNELRELACMIVRMHVDNRLTDNQLAWACKLFVSAQERLTLTSQNNRPI